MSGSGTAASVNVANGIAMSSNGDLGLVDGTGLASNYSLNSTVINITQRVLNSSGSKTYDANTDALDTDITLSNLVSGESLNHSGTATLSSANAGSYTISNLTGISIADNAGLASNYTLTGGTHNFTVNQKAISLSGTRLYDATTDAVASDLTTISGRVGTETLTLSGTGSVADANVGVKTVSVGTLALGDGTGLAANYTLSGGTHQLTINQRPLNATIQRVYNGGLDASGSDFISFDALQGGETIILSGTGAVTNKNVSSNQSVTLGSLALDDTSATGLVSNYILNSAILNITQRPISTVYLTKLYDASTVVQAADLQTMTNLVSGESLTLTGTSSIANANVGVKTVNTGGFTLNDEAGANASSGGLASNYILSGGTHQLTINQRPLAATIARQYDGTKTAAGSDFSSFDALQGGETLTLSGSGTVGDENVASGLAVALGTLALVDGTGQASNYSLNSASLNITQRVLNSSGSKTYDANTDALDTDIILSNLVSGESLNHSGTATLSSANAGSYTISNLTGISIADNAGLASNYTLTGGTHNFTVNQKAISLSGTRLYDATTDAVASDLTTISGRVGTETLTLSGTGSVADANVGVETVSVGTLALGDGTGLAANYTLSGGTHQLTINQRPLNATLSRQYDGTATSAGSDFSSFDALQGGETLTMSGSGTAASVNVANGIAMSSNGDLGLVDGTGLASNYSLNSTVINITQRVLNSSGSKTYDANTDALDADITLSNLVSGETLNHSGTATLSSANAGSYTISNLTGISIADNAGLASNYTLTGGTHNFTVNPKVVSIQGNKTYDGNTTINTSDITAIVDTVGSETLVMSSGTGTLSSANVNNYFSGNINEGSLTLGDGTGLASNYTLTGHAASTFQVTQAPVTLSGSKTYDSTTTVSSSNLTVASGLIGSETLVLTGDVDTNSANAGTYVASSGQITPTSIALADGSNGGLAANYAISDATVTINQKAISLSGTRLYDATTDAVASDLTTISGRVGTETLTLSGTGSVADANVGVKTVSVGTLALGDGTGLAANYTLSGGTHQLTINQRPLNATLSRQYDGTATSAGSDFSSFDALQGGETLTMSGSGTAASVNVANGIAMSSNGDLGLVDGTGLASNYSLNSTVINITQRVLNSSGSKTYDANTDALDTDIILSNLVSGESLNHSGTATLSSANAGSYTISNLTGISIADNAGLASNYTLTGGTHNFTVNPKVVSIQGNKTYDGNTTINTSDITAIVDTVGSETLVMSSGTGTLSSANVNNYFSGNINEGSLTLGDGTGLASNYTLTGHAASTFQVTQAPVTLSGSKTYDSTTTVSSSNLTVASGLIGSETLGLTGDVDTNSANAGTYVASSGQITPTSIALADGSNGGLAANYAISDATVTINQKAISLSGTRLYDATTDAVASDLTTISGRVGAETLTLSGTGSVADANVGVETVTVGSLALGDGTGLAANYTLSGGTHQLTINQAPISFTGTRTYNATTNVEVANITLTGQQGGEDLTVTGVGSITSGNVGSGKTANVTGLTLGDGVSGTPGTATNYTFTGGTQTFDVTQAPLTISGSREYDGTQKIESSSMSLSGLQGGETLTINDSILTTSSNVGTYSTGTSTILDGDLNSATYKKISSQAGDGAVNWPGTGSSSLSKNSGESDSDFLQRALGLLETSGGVGQYFVVNYTDATKTTISHANLASNASNVGGT